MCVYKPSNTIKKSSTEGLGQARLRHKIIVFVFKALISSCELHFKHALASCNKSIKHIWIAQIFCELSEKALILFASSSWCIDINFWAFESKSQCWVLNI